jgi:hypothetical protein
VELPAQPSIQALELVGVLAAGFADLQVSAEPGGVGGLYATVQPGMDETSRV